MGAWETFPLSVQLLTCNSPVLGSKIYTWLSQHILILALHTLAIGLLSRNKIFHLDLCWKPTHVSRFSPSTNGSQAAFSYCVIFPSFCPSICHSRRAAGRGVQSVTLERRVKSTSTNPGVTQVPLQCYETLCPAMSIRGRCMPAGQGEDFCKHVHSKCYQRLLTPEGHTH